MVLLAILLDHLVEPLQDFDNFPCGAIIMYALEGKAVTEAYNLIKDMACRDKALGHSRAFELIKVLQGQQEEPR